MYYIMYIYTCISCCLVALSFPIKDSPSQPWTEARIRSSPLCRCCPFDGDGGIGRLTSFDLGVSPPLKFSILTRLLANIG